MEIKRTLTYDDVLLEPQYSNIESRADVDLSRELDGDRKLALPIISSPMDTVTEADMASALAQAGGLGIVHRYNSIEEQVAIVTRAQPSLFMVGAAIGVTGDFKERATELVEAGALVLCVDVAHGHHILVKKALHALRAKFDKRIHIMAGNVATAQGYLELSDWGADSVRCNVGGGSICSTRIQTGHGVPGLHTIFQCAENRSGAKIIADGGIKNSGDIVKALAAGADFVMLGSLLAGTTESPGEAITTEQGEFKVYRGMASKEAQLAWRGKYSSDEGVAAAVPSKGSVRDVLAALENGVRSGFSYSGARNMNMLHDSARFLEQTAAGQAESSTHIFKARS